MCLTTTMATGLIGARVASPPMTVGEGRSAEAAATVFDRRAELREFLRSRRARLSPVDVGLAPGGRRRTPGLRREEVATLAGVGVSWYTWLE